MTPSNRVTTTMPTRRSFWTCESLVITYDLVRVHAFDGEQVESFGRVQRVHLSRQVVAQNHRLIFAQGLLEVRHGNQLLDEFLAVRRAAEIFGLDREADLFGGIARLARNGEILFGNAFFRFD